MPNSWHRSVIGSPSSRRATKRRRSSITELAFHGIYTSRPPGSEKCYPCVRYEMSPMSRVAHPQNQQKPNPDRNGATVPGQISGQICAESTRNPRAHARLEVAPRRPINSIRVGTRHRRDLGDIDGLAVSIADVGMLHPIVITPDGMLVAGERRLIACKQLGWTEIAVTIVDLDDMVRGQLAENAIRKDFLPSEIDAIRRRWN